jgi:hypothetical protein
MANEPSEIPHGMKSVHGIHCDGVRANRATLEASGGLSGAGCWSAREDVRGPSRFRLE